ncbi:MAG: hydroxypyruvate isomerase family protein [Tepidisphaerales bacterium]
MNQSDNLTRLSRRGLLAAAGITAATALGGGAFAADVPAGLAMPVVKNGRINQSVCLWCYSGVKLDEMAAIAKKMGLKSIDLQEPKAFPLLKENGLVCAMTSGCWGGIGKGFNRREQHDPINESLKKLADANAEYGFPNVICFSGNRGGQDDAEGIKICAEGIKKVIGYFEQKKVTLAMELLNSRVDHKDYQCDKSAWGIELCKAVGSENFKLLYDIYHMQIMEGDLIRSIKNNHQYFAHYHTGGNPGRHEIDETQEINYPAVMKAIVETGFKGYVAQEFVPARKDKIGSLAQAVAICDV